MALAETAELAVKLSLKDGVSGPVSKVDQSFRRLDSTVSKTAKKIGTDLGHGVRTSARNLEHLAFAAGALVVGGGAAAVKWAGDFQAGLNTINTVALTSQETLTKAGEGLRTTFRETGQSMDDLLAAEYDLVSAGVKLESAQGGVNVAVKLGVGALGSTSQAVDVLTTAINSYNLKTKDGSVSTATWTKISDELAQAVADGKTKLDAIAGSYAQVAPLAAQFGVKTGEIAAAFGYLTAKGNPAAETTTQMSRAILEVVKPSDKMQSVLKKLGLSGQQLISKYGLSGGLEVVRKQAEKMHLPFQDLFGRVEGFRYALQVTGPNAEGFATELDRINHSAGMTQKQFDERAQGLNYQIGVLKANVQDAGITIGTALLPRLTDMAKKAADFLRGHQGDIRDFANQIADGFGKAADYIGRVDWAGVLDAVKGAASLGRLVAEGFMAMPGEAKQLLLGLYGLNKLSGGAVVNVGVDLLKGVGGQFFARGASPANPMWVASAGGLGGGGGGGVPGGGGGGALGFIKAAIVGAVVVEGFSIWAQSVTDAVNRNNTLKDQGLSPQEISQTKYNEANTADKQRFEKAGYGPNGPLYKALSNTRPSSPTGGMSLEDRDRRGAHVALPPDQRPSILLPALRDERDELRTLKTATDRVYTAIETRRAQPSTIKSTVNVAVNVTISERAAKRTRAIAASHVTGHAINRGPLAEDM